jgi:mannose-6-phosphate isomerase-like protein (cupin superfamily)
MDVEEKPWGTIRRLYRDCDVEVVKAEIVHGGYSSLHRHLKKDNIFVVLSGTLQVNRHQTSDEKTIVKQHYLHADDGPLLIPAGEWHRFIALDDTVVVEVYRRRSGLLPDPDDIERADKNGVLNGTWFQDKPA